MDHGATQHSSSRSGNLTSIGRTLLPDHDMGSPASSSSTRRSAHPPRAPAGLRPGHHRRGEDELRSPPAAPPLLDRSHPGHPPLPPSPRARASRSSTPASTPTCCALPWPRSSPPTHRPLPGARRRCVNLTQLQQDFDPRRLGPAYIRKQPDARPARAREGCHVHLSRCDAPNQCGRPDNAAHSATHDLTIHAGQACHKRQRIGGRPARVPELHKNGAVGGFWVLWTA